MFYIETEAASKIYGVAKNTLQMATYRNSTKYDFVKLDGFSSGRGGKKLLFAVDISELKAGIKRGKLSSDDSVWMMKDNGEWKEFMMSEVLGISDGKQLNLAKASSDEYYALDEVQLEKANEIIKILKEYEEYKKAGLTSKKLCKDFGISEAKLFRCQRAYREQGIMGLTDMRGKSRRGASKLEEWMKEFVLTNFRAYGAGNFNITEMWKRVHEEHARRSGYNYYGFLAGKVKPLFDTAVIKRFLDGYFADKPLEYTMITKGEDKAKSYFQPAMGDQGEIVLRRNQCWQIDSTPLDAMVRDGKGGEPFRPDILAIVDVYSGRSVATLARKGNAIELIRLMWKALSTFGKPDYIKGDNGKDYLSSQYQYLLNGLGIDYDRAIAYAGEEKGYIEKQHGTIQHAGISQTPGYIGYNLAMREAIEQQTAKRERKAKDKFGHVKKTNNEHLLTFEEMKAVLEKEVLKWNITAVKRKRGTSPMDRWNGDDTEIKTVEYQEFLLYAGDRSDRVVGKKGISFEAMQFESIELPPVRTEVTVRRNIDDVSEIYVFSRTGKFICIAKDKEVRSMSAEHYAMAKKVFKEDMKEIRKAIKSAKFSEFTKLNVDYDLEMMMIAHRDSLKPEKRADSENKEIVKDIKEKIKEQKTVAKMKEISADYEAIQAPKAKKNKGIKTFDEFIEEAM